MSTVQEYQEMIESTKQEIESLKQQLQETQGSEALPSDSEELQKKDFLLKHFQLELQELTAQLSELRNKNLHLAESCEEISGQESNVSEDLFEDFKNKIHQLEQENSELKKRNSEIENKHPENEVNLKATNETFVNLQRELGNIEEENKLLSERYKKFELETMKLQEKCKKAYERFRGDEESKAKLKNLEDSYNFALEIENEILDEITKTEREYFQKPSKNDHCDLKTLQNLILSLESKIRENKNRKKALSKKIKEKKQILLKIESVPPVNSSVSSKIKRDLELMHKIVEDKNAQLEHLDQEIQEMKERSTLIDREMHEIKA